MSVNEDTFNNSLIEVPFKNVREKVDDFVNSTGLTSDDDVALMFIHRLDASNNWFLTMQICTLADTGLNESGSKARKIYTIDKHGNGYRYDVFDGSSTLEDSTLPNNVSHDDNYFGNVWHKKDGTLVQYQLADNKLVKSVLFPWKFEIFALAHQNNILTDTGAKIIFASVSSDVPDSQGDSNLVMPHCIALYLKNGSGDILLGPGHYASAPFLNKGADVGGLCPPRCNIYLRPPFL